MSQSVRKGRLILRGNNSWAGQPVINTVRVKLTDEVTGVNADRAMMASWRFTGNEQKNQFIFGPQAGAITKRTNSIIDFGRDKVRDKFVFTNNTKEHGPFNHMQRYVIKNFGRNDVIELRNIGRSFTASDLRSIGGGNYVLPGVSQYNLTINTDLL